MSTESYGDCSFCRQPLYKAQDEDGYEFTSHAPADADELSLARAEHLDFHHPMLTLDEMLEKRTEMRKMFPESAHPALGRQFQEKKPEDDGPVPDNLVNMDEFRQRKGKN